MMADDRESALTRWSRRKQARSKQAHERAGSVATGAPAPAESGPVAIAGKGQPGEGQEAGAGTAEPVLALNLPDIATLTVESDFSVFLGAGVPDDVHRQAMRALWKSDPLFTVHDGLTDYNENYQTGECFTGIVRTAYRVGRGFLQEDPPVPAERADPVAVGSAPADPALEDSDAVAHASAQEAVIPAEEQPEDERLQATDQSLNLLRCNKS